MQRGLASILALATPKLGTHVSGGRDEDESGQAWEQQAANRRTAACRGYRRQWALAHEHAQRLH